MKLKNTEKKREKLTLISPEIKKQGFYASSYKTHMVARVDKSRAIATCLTSGFKLSEERAKELKAAGLYASRISLDSPFEAEHDRIRGREGAYRDSITGIKNSIAAGILTDMFVVVSPHNIDDLEEFYNLAFNLGMHGD